MSKSRRFSGIRIMGPADSKSKLGQSIAEILGTAEPIGHSTIRPGPLRNSLIYSSMALLAINPVAVNAVGLGALTVNSHLGQPLDVTVPVTLAAGESMPKDCVAPTRGNSGIGSPKNLQVKSPAATQPGTYNLRVTTTNALHEPMYEISLLIDCPGTSLLLRQYVLMLDLPGIDTTTPVTSNVEITGNIDTTSRTETTGDILTVPVVTGQNSSQAATPTSTINQRTTRSLRATRALIPAGEAYRVSKGDTLSTIAARIDGRSPNTVWSISRLIFSENSHAFISNNPDLIKLGSMIRIPEVAELVGLERGRIPIVSTATAGQVTTLSEITNEPTPAPEPAPAPATVTEGRPGNVVMEAQPSESMMTSFTQDSGAPMPDQTAEPVTEPSTEVPSAQTGNSAVTTPFLDELPAPANENGNSIAETGPVIGETEMTAMIKPASDQITTPAVTATVTEDSSGPVSSLFVFFFGLLLGALLSLAAFRHPPPAVQDWVRNLASARKKRVRDPSTPTSNDHDNIADFANAFETSEAASAFATQQQEDTEALPIIASIDDTYIVEGLVAEHTDQFEQQSFVQATTDPGTVDAPIESTPNPDEEMLAMLFDENEQTLNEQNSEIFDPTGGADTDGVDTDMADGFFEQTVEMPEFDDEADLDPTILGPMGDFEDEFPAEQGGMQVDETVQIPDADKLEASLNEFSSDDDFPSDIEDADLTMKLQEALTLLEDDFDVDLTASQRIEQAKMVRSPEAPDTEIANDLESLEDKIDS
jgi:Tfp pilus assembly protein FimV